MDVIIDRVCGVDIGKAVLAATVRTPAEGAARKRREETRKFPTFVGDLDRLAEWLTPEGVTVVAMERRATTGVRCGGYSNRPASR